MLVRAPVTAGFSVGVMAKLAVIVPAVIGEYYLEKGIWFWTPTSTGVLIEMSQKIANCDAG